MADIIALGELLVDFCSTEADVDLIDAPGFAKAPGGAPANVAVGAAKLGRSAAFIGKVGNDPFGHFLKQALDRQNVDTSRLAMIDDVRTTLAFVAVRSQGGNDFIFYRNPGADQELSPDDIDPAFIAAGKVLHYGSISTIDAKPREATLKALRLAGEAGLLRSYDPNYRPALWPSEDLARRRMAEGFAHADLAKISDQEWGVVCGTDDFEDGAKGLLDAGVKLVVQSRGPDGAAYYSPRASGHVPGFEVDAIETTGSGDGFVASMLVDLLDRGIGRDDLGQLDAGTLDEIIRRANAVGAITATRYGAIPALPTAQQVDDFLATRG